jgi:hypothetical protein
MIVVWLPMFGSANQVLHNLTVNSPTGQRSRALLVKSNRKTIIAAALAFILAFLFLVPVISYAFPPGTYNCPANGCSFVHFGSVTYWMLGVGGVWTYANGYSVSTVTTTASYSVSSSISYTVTAEPTHTATVAVDSANNLQLQLSLNASSSSATGIKVTIFVDAYNPSSSTANVTSANDWVVPLNYTDGAPCGDDTYAQNPTVGFAIAQGYYTSSNVTEAELLALVNPNATYNCPLYLGYANPTGFLFQPLSDMAASYGCDQQSCMSGSASTGASGSGAITEYWSQGGTFTSFPRGTYTVLAEDEWGNTVLAYFTVA